MSFKKNYIKALILIISLVLNACGAGVRAGAKNAGIIPLPVPLKNLPPDNSKKQIGELAPTNLKVELVGDTATVSTWEMDKNAGHIGFVMQRSSDGRKTWVDLEPVNSGARKYSEIDKDMKLLSQRYFYQVVAIYEDGRSEPSNAAQAGSALVASALVASAPVASAPVASVPAASAPVASAPVASVPIASVPIASVPIASVPIASVPIASVPVGSVPVASVPVASVPVGNSDSLAGVWSSTWGADSVGNPAQEQKLTLNSDFTCLVSGYQCTWNRNANAFTLHYDNPSFANVVFNVTVRDTHLMEGTVTNGPLNTWSWKATRLASTPVASTPVAAPAPTSRPQLSAVRIGYGSYRVTASGLAGLGYDAGNFKVRTDVQLTYSSPVGTESNMQVSVPSGASSVSLDIALPYGYGHQTRVCFMGLTYSLGNAGVSECYGVYGSGDLALELIQ